MSKTKKRRPSRRPAKKRSTRARPCAHKTIKHTWFTAPDGVDRVLSRHCIACGELRPFEQPSNDELVAAEIRAAGMIADIAAYGGGESNVWSDNEMTAIVGGPHFEEFNASLWPWDPTRPIAGQYEEHLVRQVVAAGAGRLDDDLSQPRKPGCRCHIEVGDSPCPVHPSPDDDGPTTIGDVTITLGPPASLDEVLDPKNATVEPAVWDADLDAVEAEHNLGAAPDPDGGA